MTRFRNALILASVCLASMLALPGVAGAAQINVTTTTDDLAAPGAGCSLREAIAAASNNVGGGGCAAGSGADTITVPAGAYRLTQDGPDTPASGDLDVQGADALTIVGQGVVTVDSEVPDRVFDHPATGSLEIRNMTITGGNVVGVNDGGGIRIASGALTLENVTVSGNVAGNDGGGIANYATATMTNVTISGNRAPGGGGGIYAPGGSFTTLNNVTIAANTADSDASDNGDGGGISTSGESFTARNTLIGGNSDSSPTEANQRPDCESNAQFFPRHTLVGQPFGGDCLVGFDPGTNISGVDPRIEPLADNGGTTRTHLLLADSPALDKGGSAAPDECAPADQRGVSRPQGAGCDIGAFERRPDEGVPPPTAKCFGKNATIVGTAARNVLRGTAKRDVIAALGGNDKVIGLGGNDLVCGGAGNDMILGGAGKDTLLGQAGKDTLRGGAARDILKGAAGRDRLFGGAGRDKLQGGPGKDVQKQ